MKSVAIAALSATLFVSSAAATTLDSLYSSLFIFGDSLSDPGNYGPLGPQPPYVGNRFSDGPVWAEFLAAEFDADATQNYAFGGAQTVDADPLIPDWPEQFQFFLADVNGLDGGAFPGTPVVGDNPLVAIWYGANDVFASLDTLAEVDPTDPAAQAAAAAAALFEATETAKAVANIVGTLADFPLFDFDDFVVLNLPDLGAIPAYNTTPLAGAATQLSTAFNLQLVAELAALDASGNDIEVIDVFSLIGGLTQGQILPELTNVSEACLVPPTFDDTGNPTSSGSFCGIPNEYAFFDPVHPTTIVHAELSQRVRAAVIPLPATLPLALGALCILSLAGRRFRRS